jgi:flagellar FliJ protein
MARFVFRLDPVLNHRKRLEDEQQRVFALALKQFVEAETLRDDYVARRTAMRALIQDDHARMGVEELRAAYAHCAYLDREIDAQLLVIEERRVHVNAERLVLLEKTRDKKVLETLRERRRETFEREATLVEQRESDELNARYYERSSTPWEIAP